MAVGLKFRNLVNIRPVGTEVVVSEFFTIPGVAGPGSVLHRITELPLNVPLPNPQNSAVECREVDSFDVELPGPVRLIPIDQFGILTAGKFVIKSGTVDFDDTFRFGIIRFSQFDAGRRFKIIVTGRGSLVYAEDVINLNTGESLLPAVIKPGHISITPTDNFAFPGDVSIAGDLNIAGIVNKTASEVLDFTDDILLLNSGATSPGPDVGIAIERGGSNPQLIWTESDDAWSVIGTSSNNLLKAFDTGSPRVQIFGDLLVDGGFSYSGPLPLDSFTTVQEASLVIVSNVPSVFYNSDERQVKAVVSDGSGGAELVILG
jgi:hypothetical protein